MKYFFAVISAVAFGLYFNSYLINAAVIFGFAALDMIIQEKN